MRNILFWALTLSVFVLSCKKSTDPVITPTPPPAGSGDVYTVGYESNGAVTVAKYWKNKVATNLTDGTKNAQARGICISGGDVYICGMEQNAAGKYVAMYWKNGTPVILSNGTTDCYTNAIAVSGTNVFVVGFEATAAYPKFPMNWVNGTQYPGQLGPGITYAENTAISFKNGVFYVAGILRVPTATSANYYAQRWSHTLPFAYVTPIDITIDGKANGIVSDGTKMYTCGSAFTLSATNGHNAAYYWENNLPHNLTDGSKDADATAITISNSDIYVCGYEAKVLGSAISIAEYWKNGVLTVLGNGVIPTYSRGIAVSNMDVYVCGNNTLQQGSNFSYHAYLWKNGTVIDSTNSSNAAFFGVAVN